MKRYLVKEKSFATKANALYVGEEHITYYGIDNVEVACEGNHARRVHRAYPITKVAVLMNGYKSKSAAMRSWAYNNPENNDNWQSTTEIIEIEY